MNRILRIPHRTFSRIPARLLVFFALLVTSLADDQPAAVRQKLAALRGSTDPHAIETAWPYLNSTDVSVREAARTTVEAQPFDSWKQRALDEKGPWAALEALRGLVEACPKADAADISRHLCDKFTTLRLDEMSEAQQLAAVQLTRGIFTRLGPVSAEERSQMLDLWSHFPGSLTTRARAEVTRLVDFLAKAPTR